jgi:uncharacterized protein (TIRG00374 family)
MARSAVVLCFDGAVETPPRERERRPRELLGRWRAGLFGLVPDAPNRRRASDVGRLVLALGLLILVSLSVRSGTPFDAEVAGWIGEVPDRLQGLVTALRWAGSLGAVVVVVLLALVTRRFRLARDAGVAAVLAWGVSLLARGAVGWNTEVLSTPVEGIAHRFPVIELASAVAVAATVAPYLARPARRTLDALVIVAVLAAVPSGLALPADILAAVLVGWAAASVVHLIFGTPEGLASPRQVADAADDLGVRVVDVRADDLQEWGVARYRADDEQGRRLEVSVYGRDASDAQLLAKLWRFVFYRDSGQTLALTRRLQVEHEGFLILSANRAGRATPELRAAGVGGDAGDALVITDDPTGTPLADLDADRVSDDALAAIWHAVDDLGRARIAHGSIDGTAILVDDNGTVMLRDFRLAATAATDDRLRRDVANTLIATALVVGADRAVAAAHAALGSDRLRAALPLVQPAVATRASRRALHDHKKLAEEVRVQAATVLGADPPEITKLLRITPVDAAIVVGTFVGVWALIGQLSDFNDILATLKTANWWWVAIAFVLAQLTNLPQAVAVTGTVSTPLALGPVVGLQFANAFTGLAGGTVATTATTIRFFQRRGLAASVALSSGVLVSIASATVQAILFLCALPFAAGSFHLGDAGGSASGMVRVILLAIIVGGALAGVVVVVPRFRRQVSAKIRPQLDEARDNLRALVGQPRNLLRLFGGNAASQLLFALTLGASLEAYGASASLATLIVVNTLASLLGGMAPVPGGMGVMEAGLIAGLTAAGIPQDQAAAAVLTSRMFTAYLPPIWGWFTLVWLRRHEYL